MYQCCSNMTLISILSEVYEEQKLQVNNREEKTSSLHQVMNKVQGATEETMHSSLLKFNSVT